MSTSPAKSACGGIAVAELVEVIASVSAQPAIDSVNPTIADAADIKLSNRRPLTASAYSPVVSAT
jgi:hypothetical protein